MPPLPISTSTPTPFSGLRPLSSNIFGTPEVNLLIQNNFQLDYRLSPPPVKLSGFIGGKFSPKKGESNL